ncbi:MAG: hypothetical protein OIF50_05175 [Flavobacteriaceae bacterium]|nr:hypothetical protein [Flavobacteriaceae bacterium]
MNYNWSKPFLVLIFGLVGIFSAIAQGPWTQQKNKAYVQLGFSTISGYTNIFGDPDYRTDRELTDNTLQLYGEYGLSNKTTVVAALPLKMQKSNGLHPDVNFIDALTAPAGSQTALGNTTLGVKHNLIKKKWLLTAQLMLKLNTTTYDVKTGIRSGYNTNSISPVLSFGRGFSNMFIQGYAAADFRGGGYSNGYRFGAEYGLKALKPLWVIGFLDLNQSFDNGDIQVPFYNSRTAFYVNNQEYLAYGLKFIGEINAKMGLTASYASAFSGNNVAKRAAISLALYYKL